MTSCLENNHTFFSKALQIPTAISSERNATQAKALPSLRAGAGGVGGLVAVSIGGDYYFPGYDNNGNVKSELASIAEEW